MEKVIYNGIEYDVRDISFGPGNRAFRYGDALFETMHVESGELRFLNRHIQRLREGMKVMGMQEPDNFDRFPEIIRNFIQNHGILNGTLRWQVWRKEGGNYTPLVQASENLIEFRKLTELPEKVKLGISNNSTVSFSSVSKFKSSNALPYVLAGIEMQESEFNDLILLDPQGNVAECIASNLFWSNNKHWYTPSLKTGCVDGIMRRYVIEKMQESGTPLKTGEYGIEYFLDIQKAFITNSRGIFAVAVLGELSLSDQLNLPESLESLRVF